MELTGRPEPRQDRPHRLAPPGRNIAVLTWVSCFQDAGSELPYPVLPLYLTVTLGAPVAAAGILALVALGAARRLG